MTRASAAPDFHDPTRWVVVDGVPIFDEHEAKNPDGTVRKYDRARLQQIADKANARDAQGDHCPLTLGHTIPGAPEHQQPQHTGFARQFSVAYDAARKKHVIKTRYYIRADKADEARTYPRTSVEIWPDDTIDPIALLRRTPRLDLGQWTYARADGVQAYRYQMEDCPVPDPAGPPDAAAPAPGMIDQLIEALMTRFPGLAQLAAAPAPGPAPAAAPAGPAGPPMPDADADRMSRAQRGIEAARYERENAELRSQVAALVREGRVTRYERDLTTLAAQGYVFDLAEEVASVADLDQAGFDKHKERIVKRYARAPVGDLPYEVQRDPAGPEQFGKEDLDRANAYMREHPGCKWEDAKKYAVENRGK